MPIHHPIELVSDFQAAEHILSAALRMDVPSPPWYSAHIALHSVAEACKALAAAVIDPAACSACVIPRSRRLFEDHVVWGLPLAPVWFSVFRHAQEAPRAHSRRNPTNFCGLFPGPQRAAQPKVKSGPTNGGEQRNTRSSDQMPQHQGVSRVSAWAPRRARHTLPFQVCSLIHAYAAKTKPTTTTNAAATGLSPSPRPWTKRACAK